MSKDLLKEAIADAKAVKETAYANAKLALEEALAPHIQSMISAKLSEELGEDVGVTVETVDSVNEENNEYGTDDMKKVGGISEKSEKEDEKEMDEAKDESESDSKVDESSHEDDDMSDLDLEAIIRELEEELASSQIGQGDNKEPSDVASSADTEDPGKTQQFMAQVREGEAGAEDMEHAKEGTSKMIDLEELIQALREVNADDDEDEMKQEAYSDDEEDKNKMESLQADLKEAYEVITYLRNQINEINLLNAKLMYSTKLFKKFDLNESQKVKVIENLDRTKSLREAKLIFTTLAETFNSNKSKLSTLKESFASNAIPSTKPSAKTSEIISGDAGIADRFKLLAGLKK